MWTHARYCKLSVRTVKMQYRYLFDGLIHSLDMCISSTVWIYLHRDETSTSMHLLMIFTYTLMFARLCMSRKDAYYGLHWEVSIGVGNKMRRSRVVGLNSQIIRSIIKPVHQWMCCAYELLSAYISMHSVISQNCSAMCIKFNEGGHGDAFSSKVPRISRGLLSRPPSLELSERWGLFFVIAWW